MKSVLFFHKFRFILLYFSGFRFCPDYVLIVTFYESKSMSNSLRSRDLHNFTAIY